MYTCKNEIRLYEDASEELIARLRRTHMIHRGQDCHACFWLTGAEPRLLTLWQCSDIQTDPKVELDSYLTAMHFPAKETVQTLQTVREFYEALREGHRIGLCADARRILRQFSLLPFADRTENTGVWETLVEPVLLTDAEAADGSLREACKQAADPDCGSMNYYRIGAHSIDWAKRQCDRLLSHLAAIGRLPGRRAIYLTPAYVQLSDEELEHIYPIQAGSAVVILLDEYRVNREAMEETLKCMETLAGLTAAYRHEVTTIVCAGDKVNPLLTDIFQASGDLDPVRIEASYPNFSGMEVCDYAEVCRRLDRLARQHGLNKCDLADSLDYFGRFRIDDLPRMFDEWMSAQKVPAAKQHRRSKTSAKTEEKTRKKKPVRRSSAAGTALEELEALAGLTEAKRTIRQIVDYAQMQKLMQQRGLTAEMPCFHMVFTGNPGTAKTTAARLTARILQECGILSVGELVEAMSLR